MSMTNGAVIRPMRPADVDEAAELLHRHEFGDRRDFLRWAVHRPTIAPFVAVAAGRGIVATGVAGAHATTGWVGVIFVAPEARRSGLGSRITRTVLDELETRGARSQLLIASPLGQPMYERLGFRVLDRQVRFAIDGLPPDDRPLDPRIRPYRPADAASIAALDRAATGEDRRAMLEDLVKPETTLVAVSPDDPDEVRGFLARTPWRGGGLIAPDPADALRLLDRRRRSTGISGRAGAGVLASNTAGRACLREAGWHEELGNVRMIRGEPLDWQPNAIFGQFNGALG